jgi:hypothetical protein
VYRGPVVGCLDGSKGHRCDFDSVTMERGFPW